MPGGMGKKLGQKVDIDFTLRKIFGKDSFRYSMRQKTFSQVSC